MATKKPKVMTPAQAKMLGLKTVSTPLGDAYVTKDSVVSGVAKSTTPSSSSNRGGSGGGGGSASPTPQPTQSIAPATVDVMATTTNPLSPAVQQARRNQVIAMAKKQGATNDFKFTGRVQQEGGGREEYYVKGKETGRIENGKLTVSKPSFFEFRTNTPTGYKTEGVAFSKGGMQSAGTEYVVQEQTPTNVLLNMPSPTIQQERKGFVQGSTIQDDLKQIWRTMSMPVVEVREKFSNKVWGKSSAEVVSSAQGKIAGYSQTATEFYIPSLKTERLTQITYSDTKDVPATVTRSFFKGALSSPFVTASFVTGLLTPTAEVSRTIKGFKQLPAQIKAKPLSTTSELLGNVIGTSILFGGINKVATGVSDWSRTTGMKKLSVATPETEVFTRRGINTYFERNPLGQFKQQKYNIVAMEYFEGQKYPKITRGQTAGQLLEEFTSKKTRSLPYTKEGYGFTASPMELPKQTVILKGTSELPMVYQAPKLSATFLKIGGEKPFELFTGRIFDTMNPTASTIRGSRYSLIKGLKYNQRTMFPLSKAKQFYFKDAKLGEAYIPFVKIEKEGGLRFDTPVKRTGERFYFEFEDRRIPIYEYDIDKLTGIKTEKGMNVKDVLKEYGSYYYLNSNKRGAITPTELISLSRTPSYSKAKAGSYSVLPSSSITSITSKSFISLTSKPSYKSSGGSSSKIILSSSSVGSSSSNILIPSKSYYPSKPRTPYRPPYSPPKYPRYNPPVKPTPTIFKYKLPSYKQKKSQGLFAVSLRRFGKFKTVGYGKTPEQAFDIGRKQATNTLGATFKISGVTKPMKTFGFKTKKTKEGLLYIENPQFRLSKKGELNEIQYYKGLKSNKRRLF